MRISKTEMLSLQNGSDIRGVACEGIVGETVTLTLECAFFIGQAFARWLIKKTKLEPEKCVISVGMDSRITGKDLKKQVIKGFLSQKVNVFDCGLASTPAMFMSIAYSEISCTGACMITASHLPFNRNGMKFFDFDGGLEHADITDILESAYLLGQQVNFSIPHNVFSENNMRFSKLNLIDYYSKILRSYICKELSSMNNKPLEGLKIVVDAGNGAGGFFATKVLKQLGADITGSLLLEPNGTFPNHVPNPENKDAMQTIKKATLEAGADLGLIFDADVDRMAAVLEDGTPINRDAMIAMLAVIISPQYPTATIVTDSVSSDRLTRFLETNLGMKHMRYMRGYKNVINKCKELNANGIPCPLAMETSGHGCLKENYYLDDGAFLAVKLVVALAQTKKEMRLLKELLNGFDTQYVDKEVRFSLNTEAFREYSQFVLKKFKERAEASGYKLPISYEGVRVQFHGIYNGWALLRSSLHDPVMVLNVEGKTIRDMEGILSVVEKLLSGFKELECNAW